LYEVLGVERGCEERQVVRAYREAALRWHPDKWATAGEGERKEAEAKFKQIADAYNTLRDPQRRYQYDAQFVQQSATIRRTSTYTYA
jgi:molecular chaperone DnaJ